jgi:hypothetical protein
MLSTERVWRRLILSAPDHGSLSRDRVALL